MDLYFAVLVFAASTTITPGPNNIMIMTSGLNFGIKNSLPHLLGICFGFPAMVVAVGLGFGLLFEKYPLLHEIIKVLGIIYLSYLAWAIAHSTQSSLNSAMAKPMSFLKAVLFQWVNPKAWVMATGAVSAYTTLSSDILMQVIYIGLAFFLVAFPCVGIWLVFGAGLTKFLQDIKHQKMFNISMAILLLISILPAVSELAQQYIV